jgi:hypothetical protein
LKAAVSAFSPLRLIQPRRAAFWLMLAANAATAALVWVVTMYPVTLIARAVISVFAVGNLFIGLACMRALLREPSAGPTKSD